MLTNQPRLDPASWEASESYQTIQRLRAKISNLTEYIPSHLYHRVIDPINTQIADLYRRLCTQHDHITKLEYENGVLNRLKRADMKICKLEREEEELRAMRVKNMWLQGKDITFVDNEGLVVEKIRELGEARVGFEEARRVFGEWVRKESECRL
jgi:hypothetical protein